MTLEMRNPGGAGQGFREECGMIQKPQSNPEAGLFDCQVISAIDLNGYRSKWNGQQRRDVDERPRIISALEFITADDHDTFFVVLACVQNELGENGRDIAETWAQQQKGSRFREFKDVWRSLGQGKGYGIGTLYKMARENGWSDDVQTVLLTSDQLEARVRSREEAQRLNREAEERNRARAKAWTREILEAATHPNENPYLKRKLVSMGYGLKTIFADRVAEILGYRAKNERGELQGELLVVPCFRDFEPAPCTLELIDGDGLKYALKGGGRGIYATAPFPAPGPPSLTFYVGEGVATCLSVSHAMQSGIGVAAFSNGQLGKTAQAIRGRYPDAKIVLLADLKKDSGAPDEKAVEAAKLVGGYLAMPDFGSGREPGQTDFNDLHVAKGLDAVRACIGTAKPTAQEETVWDNPADIATMLVAKPEPMKWLVTERAPFGRGGALAALGGTGKTTLLKALAIGCITGRLPMDGWEVERTGKVVLVLTEDTHAEFHEDLHRLCYSMTTRERELIARNLIVYPLAGKDTRLLTKSPRGVVEKSPLYHALIAKIQAIGGVVLVGLDPALGITEGDEMNQTDQRALGRAVDDLGVTVGATCILLSHSAKGLLNAKELGSHSSRGGGALTDALRFEITMRGMTAEEATAHGIKDLEERLHLVQVAITKGNRIPPSAKVPVWLRYDSGTLVSAGLVEPEKKTRAGGTKLPKSAALALEAIKEATMERGQIDDATGRPYVAMDEVRITHKDLYTQRNPANGDRAERKALQDGTSKLAEIGWIKSDGLTVSFSGPGAEAHIQNILAAMAERQRNFGTERNFSELSSAKGTLKSGTERNPPLYIGGSGSAKFRGDFDQDDETRSEQSENIPSSPGTKINPLAHGMWPEGVIHVPEDCAGHPQLCEGCIHSNGNICDGLTAPF